MSSTDDIAEQVAANRANWDARAVVHAASSFYDIERYVNDPLAISKVVDWDRGFFGDVAGLDLLHIQCHIGTDSISLARLGANVTALDFSPRSLDIARDLATRTGTSIDFVCADALQASRVLGRQFDLVYASVGVLCWIPSIQDWAAAAAACVRPGGRLYLRDGHPIKDTFDYQRDDNLVVCVGDYFGEAGPYRDDAGYTYTGDDVLLAAPVNFQWAHPLGSVVTALADNGLRIDRVDEFDWLDWQAFPWMVRGSDGRWRLPAGHPHLPLAFSIMASHPKDGE